jgi:hypothetical protein
MPTTTRWNETTNETEFHCSTCGQFFPRSGFFASRSRANGIHSRCRTCYLAYQASWRAGRRASGLSSGLTFGVEIETFGPGRAAVAAAVAAALGGTVEYVGGHYDIYTVKLADGRSWSFVMDSSIPSNTDGSRGGCEVVSPILRASEPSDMAMLQSVVRAVRATGSRVDLLPGYGLNAACGLHVHVGGHFTTAILGRLTSQVFAHQNAIFAAIAVLPSRERYCRKIESHTATALGQAQTSSDARHAWYGRRMSAAGARMSKYNDSRYQALNLHSYFYRGTVEFRMFNATLHAGLVRAYVELALGMVVSAKNADVAISTTSLPATVETMTALLDACKIADATVRSHLLKTWITETNAEEVAA